MESGLSSPADTPPRRSPGPLRERLQGTTAKVRSGTAEQDEDAALGQGQRPRISRKSRRSRTTTDPARSEALAVLLLADAVGLELLVEVRARRADGGGGGRDVPAALAQLLDQERALGAFLEVAQRRGAPRPAGSSAGRRSTSFRCSGRTSSSSTMISSRSTAFFSSRTLPRQLVAAERRDRLAREAARPDVVLRAELAA